MARNEESQIVGVRLEMELVRKAKIRPRDIRLNKIFEQLWADCQRQPQLPLVV